MLNLTKQDSITIAVTLGIALSVPLVVPAFYTTSNVTVLEQADQRKLIINPKQLWLDGIQLVPHEMMKSHPRVLRCALN